MGLSFSGVELSFSVPQMLNTAVSFLGIYKEYIILVLASIAIYFIMGPVLKLVNRAAGGTLYGSRSTSKDNIE